MDPMGYLNFYQLPKQNLTFNQRALALSTSMTKGKEKLLGAEGSIDHMLW